MSMIFLGKMRDSHGGFSTSMVHVREKLQDPGAESHHRLRRGAPRLARWLGSENWVKLLKFSHRFHTWRGMLTFGRLRKYVEVSTFDIPPMKLGMGSSAGQARGTPIDG